jgi:hypothetical protein
MVMTPPSTRAQSLGGSAPDGRGVEDAALEQAASTTMRSVATDSSRREAVRFKEGHPFWNVRAA